MSYLMLIGGGIQEIETEIGITKTKLCLKKGVA